jgi:hypothetical protein
MNKSIQDFLFDIQSIGCSIFENVVPEKMLAQLRYDIEKQEQKCLEWQIKNGIAEGMAGSGHHILGGGDSLDDFLYEFYLDEYIHAYFDAPYILNAYGVFNNRPYSANPYLHGQGIHRDVRTYSKGFRLMLNMLVMIDDFTVENGATRVLFGSHHIKERPTNDCFEKNAVQITGKAGSIVLFDSDVWHAAAQNRTNKPRKALTPMFTRAFMKQQMDYPRMLGEDFPKNEKMRQLLGYNSRVPVNHNEWYQPPEKRMYKPGQG